MKIRFSCAGLVAALLLSWSGSSSAQEAHGMAEKGNLFISADRLVPFFGYTNRSVEETEGNTTTTVSSSGTGFSLLTSADLSGENMHTLPRPAVDLTVIPHLTVGVAIPIGFGLGGSTETEVKTSSSTTTRSVDSPTRTLFGVVPRVGYILPLNDFLAFWPRGGFGIYSASVKSENEQDNGPRITRTSSEFLFSLDLDPQLVITPAEHFFFSVGPLVNIPLTGSATTETSTGSSTNEQSNDLSVFHIGLSASIGGWIGPMW